jgi:hypothetical protein
MGEKPPSERAIKAAAHRRRTRAADEQAREELAAAIVADLDSGVSQADLMRLTGYSRERLRQIAKEAALEARIAELQEALESKRV